MDAVQADVVVLARELPEVQLLVEVKRGVFDRAEVQQQLKTYMVARNCPLALLVTPTTSWLLRDTYESSDETAIELTGEYATSDLLGLDEVPDSERELTARLHDWLEGLAATGDARRSRAGARDDVSLYLLPAVVEGRVFTEVSR